MVGWSAPHIQSDLALRLNLCGRCKAECRTDAANYLAWRAIVAGSQIKPGRSRGQVEAMRLIVGIAWPPTTAAPKGGFALNTVSH